MILLQKYWQYAMIGILLVICIFSIKSCKNQKELVRIEKSKSDSSFHQAEAVILKNGELTFRVNTLEVTNKQLKGENIIGYVAQKKLEEQVGNLNRVVAYYKGSLTMDETFASGGTDTVILRIHDRDTVRTKEKYFPWHNNWLSLNSIYNPLTDSIKHRYLYRVEFNMVSYRKDQNFFRRGQLVSEITFADPAILVGESQAVIVIEPPKKFYETTLFKVLVGTAIGIAISH